MKTVQCHWTQTMCKPALVSYAYFTCTVSFVFSWKLFESLFTADSFLSPLFLTHQPVIQRVFALSVAPICLRHLIPQMCVHSLAPVQLIQLLSENSCYPKLACAGRGGLLLSVMWLQLGSKQLQIVNKVINRKPAQQQDTAVKVWFFFSMFSMQPDLNCLILKAFDWWPCLTITILSWKLILPRYLHVQ